MKLKVRACQRLFHETGFSLKRARPVVARASEEKKAESKKTSGKKQLPAITKCFMKMNVISG
jgi:transposase